MTGFVALLRGVNLAGNSTLRMADLKAIADSLGLRGARTFIASGNLLFSSDEPEESLRDALEQSLRTHMGKDIRVMLRSAGDMAAIAAANPFPGSAGNRVQVFFLETAPPADLLDTLRNQDDERVAAGPREVYVAYGERGIGRSRLGIPAAAAATARNMNTVAKLAELARELA